MNNKFLWEILVPTVMDRNGFLRPIRTVYHKGWDEKVRAIAGGLTIFQPAKGHWISMEEELFTERMIPVRICCTEEQINQISDMTAEYYNQKAIMFYCVTEKIQIKNYE